MHIYTANSPSRAVFSNPKIVELTRKGGFIMNNYGNNDNDNLDT